MGISSGGANLFFNDCLFFLPLSLWKESDFNRLANFNCYFFLFSIANNRFCVFLFSLDSNFLFADNGRFIFCFTRSTQSQEKRYFWQFFINEKKYFLLLKFMTARLDFLTKWYLRLVAIIWLSFVPLLYLITFLAGNENISFAIFLSSLFEWAILLPFGFEQTIPVEFVPFIRFFFWSFWIITISRWVISGRHFYQ